MKQRRGRLHYIIFGSMVLIFLLMALCIDGLWDAGARIKEKNLYEVSEDICREQSDALKDASDYLTEQFRSFIFTADERHLRLYWEEALETRRRETAMGILEQADLTEEETGLVKAARAESYRLQEREAWAMRLMEESKGVPEEEMIPQLRAVSLTAEEAGMTPENKRNTAQSFMFSPEYESSKDIINGSLRKFQSMLSERKERDVEAASQKVRGALGRVQLYNILSVSIIFLLIFLFYYYVVMPFLRYSEELEHIDPNAEEALKPGGFREMRTLGTTFNSIYSDLRQEKKKLERLSSLDCLTEIANRGTLDDYVGDLIRKNEANIGFLMMDIDNFKSFNDGFGHLIGDQVLIRMGQCFKRIAAGRGGIAGRLGGEEFIIVVSDVTKSDIESMASEIMDAVMNIDTKELGIAEDGIRITVSVGSTIWPKGRDGDINALINQADMALYQAKERGKNQHVMFSEREKLFVRMEEEKLRRREVEASMYKALEQNEFIPFFQPKYDLETGKICGAEALVRWENEKNEYLYPDYFVPILEKDGFITRIDFAMFERICACISEWKREGIGVVPVACNFSRLNFGKETLVTELKRITEKYDVPPSLIQVELTEGGLLEKEDMEKVEREFEELHKAGFAIAIDDFGTGYSSLGMLHEFSVDILKVDKSFVHRDLSLRANELLLNGILYIAQVMNLDTVVEGVETKEQAELLRRLGYRVVQGFYFSKPVEKDKFEEMLKKQGEVKE